MAERQNSHHAVIHQNRIRKSHGQERGLFEEPRPQESPFRHFELPEINKNEDPDLLAEALQTSTINGRAKAAREGWHFPTQPSPKMPPNDAMSASNDFAQVQKLRAELKTLQMEKQELKARFEEPAKELQIIYRVNRSSQTQPDLYLDCPQWLKGDKDMTSLQGRLPISNLDSYLDRHPEIAFVVFRDTKADESKGQSHDEDPGISWQESINFVSLQLVKNLEIIFSCLPEHVTHSINFNMAISEVELSAPYLPFYHYREDLVKSASFLNGKPSLEWDLLLHYIDKTYGDEYDYVNQLLEAGTISREFIHYLVKPGDVLVQPNGRPRSAYLATSEPNREDFSVSRVLNAQKPAGHSLSNQLASYEVHTRHGKWCPQDSPTASKNKDKWEIQTEVWEFDGNFQKKQKAVHLSIPGNSEDFMQINSLDIYPSQFAKPGLINKIRDTGLQLWKSRYRRYVSYHPARSAGDAEPAEHRYMIDPATYKKLHKKDSAHLALRDDLGSRVMSARDPPHDPFLLLLPSTIDGFNMQNKRWEELEVSRISDVTWNKEAFDNLVVEPFTKTLIKALVMQQLEKEKGTDLIAGKGQGLIVLLHGGPGTGKTFTAETVAEIAEKPLYRVTCGDLGTEPTEVEKYLESVLYLGKIWDCVVLLDEADVYLEERSMESLARNALVSVFLRVLEYYEGILILTSNRVGTFDESFKSRIQLALHYEKLKLKDRKIIWENFFRRLQTFDEVGIDFDDVYKHINDLARNELNGRQIRNAITTGRQLSRHLEKDLDYEDLQKVIKIALKFDRLTTDMQGGMNDDERKREDGIRP